MVKIKLGKLLCEVSSLNFSFSVSFIFLPLNPLVCFVFLLRYVLTCLPRLGLSFCMLKMHVRVLELLF